MDTPYLASVYSIYGEVMDLAGKKESIPPMHWNPILKKFHEAIQGGVVELKRYQLHDKFSELTEVYLKEFSSLIEEMKQYSELVPGLKGDIALEMFETVIDDMDNQKNLESEDLYLIIYILLSKFLERVEERDYSEFVELYPHDKIVNSDKLGCWSIAWIFILRGESYSRANSSKGFPEEFKNDYDHNPSTLYSRITAVRKEFKIIETKKYIPLNYSENKIALDLDRAITYLQKIEEKDTLEEALRIKDELINHERKSHN